MVDHDDFWIGEVVGRHDTIRHDPDDTILVTVMRHDPEDRTFELLAEGEQSLSNSTALRAIDTSMHRTKRGDNVDKECTKRLADLL